MIRMNQIDFKGQMSRLSLANMNICEHDGEKTMKCIFFLSNLAHMLPMMRGHELY